MQYYNISMLTGLKQVKMTKEVTMHAIHDKSKSTFKVNQKPESGTVTVHMYLTKTICTVYMHTH